MTAAPTALFRLVRHDPPLFLLPLVRCRHNTAVPMVHCRRPPPSAWPRGQLICVWRTIARSQKGVNPLV